VGVFPSKNRGVAPTKINPLHKYLFAGNQNHFLPQAAIILHQLQLYLQKHCRNIEMFVMKRKYKQSWSTIPSISTKRTISSHHLT
jgi:hypothetical protein